MRFIKKNQVIIFSVGLMLIAAGYLNFTNNENNNNLIETGTLLDSEQMAEIGDATLVSTTPVENNIVVEQDNENIESTNSETNNEISDLQTNASVTTDEYFSKSRLERDTMYSQMIESYQKILDKPNISESQKNTAQNEITKINEQKNALMITENLIKTKGFEDLIIFINDKSINVIIKSKELKSEQIAQIQNIITRELKASISDIHITNKST